ncbi:aromatic ring-hydroxylating dioxygenase subunit alpha [Novosphingobium sp. KCTC 2891]|uniref:aromatic ring-hydroxylating oxygenase subunit alpha n=1 Tax=Novosphingobium sp. KCTC 2891 TaxID=2989730 RepID=UPI002222BF33|nr:aromatic ring-hydroxylating dioxygenase subunit alpha [Novosphingobium sp. KCTC 2891]MCW1384486.1 aromatic ring-hydroxylating dioxygenase subunit alpha [Novosphingobium sp. KCTC 2891]
MNIASSMPPLPGDARCPGPSTRDIILADGQDVPAALVAEAYSFGGDADLDYDRYVSPDFMALEFGRMWARTWQWVCREEHVPDVGDYVTYDIGPYSILVVRSAPDQIKAYHNACLHRGTQLKRSDSAGHAQELRCPFHGWSWSLDGALGNVPCRWDFPHVRDEAYRLPEVKMETWGGFVFVNLDPAAAPLAEQLGPLAEHFTGRWDLADRRIALHLQKELPTNWKAAQEAFLEAYHVYETHTQGLATASDANAQYDIFSDHVTRFVHTIGVPSPHYQTPQTEQEIYDKMRVEPGVVPEGRTARSYAAERVRARIAAATGVPLDAYSDSETLDSIEYHLFPNMCLFPGVSLPMIYRFRPIGSDPSRTLFDLVFLKLVPPGTPPEHPPEPVQVGANESYADAPGMDPGLGAVYDQDTDNLAMQYRGFQASAKRGQTLGNYQEARIRRFHQTLDDYLARA